LKSIEQIKQEINASKDLIDKSRRLFELIWMPFGRISTDEYMPLVNKFQYRCNVNPSLNYPPHGPFIHYQSLLTKEGIMRITKSGLKTEQVRAEMLLDKYAGIEEVIQRPPTKRYYTPLDPSLKKKPGRPRKY